MKYILYYGKIIACDYGYKKLEGHDDAYTYFRTIG